jgi:hypothetical protein
VTLVSLKINPYGVSILLSLFMPETLIRKNGDGSKLQVMPDNYMAVGNYGQKYTTKPYDY